MDKLLIIGASGMIGSKFAEIAEGRYQVFGTYNTHTIKGKSSFKLDVADRNATFKLMDSIKPDFVIDAHGMTSFDDCELQHEAAWKVNVEGSKNVAEACKKIGSKYVLLSIDEVFDGKRLKYTEKDKIAPLNYLSSTKAVMEGVLTALDINHLIVRTSTVYGKSGPGRENFTMWLIKQLKSKQKVRIVTDRKSNPTFVDNMAEILLELCRKDETGIFHIAGQECINRYDFSKEIAQIFELDSNLIKQIMTPELNQVAIRPGSVNLSSDKAEHATRIRSLSVREGLELLKMQIGE